MHPDRKIEKAAGFPAAFFPLSAAERRAFRAGSRICLAAAAVHTDTICRAFAIRIIRTVFSVAANIQFLVWLIIAARILRG